MSRYVQPIPNAFGKFAGRCIDGPCAGEFRECVNPWFRVAKLQHMRAVPVWDWDKFEPTIIEQAEYRWSNSLHQWCLYDVG